MTQERDKAKMALLYKKTMINGHKMDIAAIVPAF
jgi:hypothetical protein